MKKTPSKVGYFSKIAESYATAMNAQLAPKQQKVKNYLSVSIVHGIYNFAYEVTELGPSVRKM